MEHETFIIYKTDRKIDISSLNQLKIGGKIGFLREILLVNSDLLEDGKGGWILNFFKGKPYEQHIYVSSSKLDFKVFKKLTTASFICSNEFRDVDAENLSISVRGSKSIKKCDFIEYPSHYAHIDGRGLSFFSKIENQKDNFYRQIILLSLAYAYLGAIEYISNNLSQKVNCASCDIDELNKLYIETAKFNSIFLFHQPVLIDKASLTEAWKEIDRVFEIDVSSKELLEQLSNVHYILNLDSENKKLAQEKEKQSKQEKWNLFFAIIGIILAAIELFK